MDSNHGGQSSRGAQNQEEKRRQTAAVIARKKVLAAYGRKAVEQAEQAQGSRARSNANGANTYGGGQGRNAQNMNSANGGAQNANLMMGGGNSAVQTGVNGTHLKDQPTISRANSEDWRKYHSAWQNYYQKYYSEYYANAARNYVERAKLKEARRQAEEQDTLAAIGKRPHFGKQRANEKAETKATEGENADIDDIGAKLKQTIRQKAVKSAKKTRRHRRWIPVFAGVFVVLLVLFMQYNRLIFAPIFAYVSPGNAPATEIEAIDPTVSQAVSADPRLIIPKLNVDVPIHFGLKLSEVMDAMNSGVAHYRIAGASAYPGEIGNTVITGHSAGDVYSSNPYKYIFSGLERLEDGDLIYVNYESVRYTYQVTKKQVIEPSNVAALVIDTDKPMLTLVTCTPLGTSRYRLLVFAEQISPNPEEAEETGTASDTVINVEDKDNSALPSNEPSFFEGIWNFMTGR